MVHNGDTFSVYIITNNANGKKYVGSTRLPLKERFQGGKGYRNNKEFHSDIQKYGWYENFTHEVIAENLNREDASVLESELICSIDENMRYNKLTDVGHGLYGYSSKPHNGRTNGMRHSEETKKRMSESHKGIKQSDEWVEKRIGKVRGKSLVGERKDFVVAMCRANSEKRKRPIKAVRVDNGDTLMFDSIKDAHIALGVTDISRAIKTNGTRKGYVFSYV